MSFLYQPSSIRDPAVAIYPNQIFCHELTADIINGGGGGGSGTVTSVDITSTNLTVFGGPITTSGTFSIKLPETGVVPGYYPSANVSVDATGRVTGASAGSASGITANTVYCNAGVNDFQTAVNTAITQSALTMLPNAVMCSPGILTTSGDPTNITISNAINGLVIQGFVGENHDYSTFPGNLIVNGTSVNVNGNNFNFAGDVTLGVVGYGGGYTSTFTNFSISGNLVIVGSGNYVFNNSQINGNVSIGATSAFNGTVTFVDCTFLNPVNAVLAISMSQQNFTNCNFLKGFTIETQSNINFHHCVIAGTASQLTTQTTGNLIGSFTLCQFSTDLTFVSDSTDSVNLLDCQMGKSFNLSSTSLGTFNLNNCDFSNTTTVVLSQPSFAQVRLFNCKGYNPAFPTDFISLGTLSFVTNDRVDYSSFNNVTYINGNRVVINGLLPAEYSLPVTAGNPGDSLKWPSSGTQLIWAP